MGLLAAGCAVESTVPSPHPSGQALQVYVGGTLRGIDDTQLVIADGTGDQAIPLDAHGSLLQLEGRSWVEVRMTAARSYIGKQVCVSAIHSADTGLSAVKVFLGASCEVRVQPQR